jgi:large subunit ribosomal protein L9
MKVILIQDVKALGKKGDIVEISDGYAKNYILPKKLGREATAKNLNDLKLKNQNEEKLAREAYENALAFAQDIKEKVCEVRIKTGEGGRTFGSVSSKEIAAAFKEQFGVEIDKKKLQIGEPIRSLGFHKIPYKAHSKVTAEITVHVGEEE